ncbi:hypothetical protein H6792_00135 [Candidatus Nomurabacteria bacterium]|nr:hypothetical protein [Candidatus Nomurabacteria bacterium]
MINNEEVYPEGGVSPAELEKPRLSFIKEVGPDAKRAIGCVDERLGRKELEGVLASVPGGLAGFALVDYMINSDLYDRRAVGRSGKDGQEYVFAVCSPMEIVGQFLDRFSSSQGTVKDLDFCLHQDTKGESQYLGCGFLARLNDILINYKSNPEAGRYTKGFNLTQIDLEGYQPGELVERFTVKADSGVKLRTLKGEHTATKGLIIDNPELYADRAEMGDDTHFVLDLGSVLNLYRERLGYNQDQLKIAKSILIDLFRATLAVLSEGEIGDSEIVDVNGEPYQFDLAV